MILDPLEHLGIEQPPDVRIGADVPPVGVAVTIGLGRGVRSHRPAVVRGLQSPLSVQRPASDDPTHGWLRSRIFCCFRLSIRLKPVADVSHIRLNPDTPDGSSDADNLPGRQPWALASIGISPTTTVASVSSWNH